jgi:hypothetical protein
MTGLTLRPCLVVISVTGLTGRLTAKRRAIGMARCAADVSVDVMIEDQRACSNFGWRQLESYGYAPGLRCNFPNCMTALALRVARINMVAIHAPLVIGHGRCRSGTVALGALVGRVKRMLKT